MVSYWDKDGNPLTLLEWADRREDPSYRVVAEDNVDGRLVRTQWEGIDDGVHVACMWATGVSLDEGKKFRTVWEGYYPCTQDEAQAAHEQAVVNELLAAARPAELTFTPEESDARAVRGLERLQREAEQYLEPPAEDG